MIIGHHERASRCCLLWHPHLRRKGVFGIGAKCVDLAHPLLVVEIGRKAAPGKIAEKEPFAAGLVLCLKQDRILRGQSHLALCVQRRLQGFNELRHVAHRLLYFSKVQVLVPSCGPQKRGVVHMHSP